MGAPEEGDPAMPPLNLLIKPASGRCNLRCKYCFYTDETQKRAVSTYEMMTPRTLEAVVSKALEAAQGSCCFGFQGGEPTLTGLDFYRLLIELEAQYNRRGLPITHTIQTNGLLLDEAWACFLKENHFLVGLSLDGPAQLHDANRPDLSGKGTFARVMGAARLLGRHGVDFNILTVVNARNVHNPERLYRFFMKNGLYYQQYIPCLDPLYSPGGAFPCSLPPAAYGEFLIRLFDLWLADVKAGRFVYIRYFENFAGMLLGGPPESCGLSGRCINQHVVESDGGVYPCDFYVLDEYRLGNLNTDSFAQIEQRYDALDFADPAGFIRPECRECRWFRLCRGGCRRDRQGAALSQIGENRLCPAFQMFFEHAVPRLSRWLAVTRGFQGFRG